MKHLFGAVLAALLLAMTPALAQQAITVGNTSALMVVGQSRNSLSVCNVHATASISICFADTTGSCTAVVNTAGQYMVGPLQCLKFFPEDRPPSTAIYAISSTGSVPVTVNQK